MEGYLLVFQNLLVESFHLIGGMNGGVRYLIKILPLSERGCHIKNLLGNYFYKHCSEDFIHSWTSSN